MLRRVNEQLDNLAKILQASISPMALISGVGLLILSLTNRFSRVADRLRELAEMTVTERATLNRDAQIRIFEMRAELLRNSITCAVGSVLVTSGLVLALFVIAVFHIEAQGVVFALFGCSLLLLIASLILFLRDMHWSLRALREQLKSRPV